MGRMENGNNVPATRDSPFWSAIGRDPDRTLRFTDAESVIVKDGQRLLSFQAERSAVVTIDWHLETYNLVTQQYQRTDL